MPRTSGSSLMREQLLEQDHRGGAVGVVARPPVDLDEAARGVERAGRVVVLAHLEQQPVGVPGQRLVLDPGEQAGGEAGTPVGRRDRDPLQLGDVGDDAGRGVAHDGSSSLRRRGTARTR